MIVKSEGSLYYCTSSSSARVPGTYLLWAGWRCVIEDARIVTSSLTSVQCLLLVSALFALAADDELDCAKEGANLSINIACQWLATPITLFLRTNR